MSNSAILTTQQGQCRDTTIYEETTPLIVTVDVNTTTVKEFVFIVPTTVTTVSIVEYKQTAQCIIKRTSTGLASSPISEPSPDQPGNGSGSAQPTPDMPSPLGTAPSIEPYVEDSNSDEADTDESPPTNEDQDDENTRYVHAG